jgi:hypothetical protein
MINKDRVVATTAIDLITLYSRIFAIANVTVSKVDAIDANGDFSISENPANALLASEPVKSFDFASGATAATVYFAPTYDYEGFKIAGVAVETAGAEVDADHANLYSATLSTGTVTIAKVGL